MGKKRKKEVYKFTGRSHSIKGMASAVLGGIGGICLLVLFILSGIYRGNASIVFGAVGMVLFALAVTGFVLGAKACLEKEIYYTAPVTGMAVNGILSVALLVLYITGIFM